jgi:hypothetical protein
MQTGCSARQNTVGRVRAVGSGGNSFTEVRVVRLSHPVPWCWAIKQTSRPARRAGARLGDQPNALWRLALIQALLGTVAGAADKRESES